jgi:hypothetical protein
MQRALSGREYRLNLAKDLEAKGNGDRVLFNRAQINAFVLISLPSLYIFEVAIWTA